MDNKQISLVLRKAYRSLASEIDMNKVTKIIPVAFPVLQSTWRIKILLEEPVGMIDRYILRVLKEFGPSNVKRIDAILCLGEDRIDHALKEMKRLGAPVVFEKGLYSINKNDDIDHFRVEQEHSFSFCINAITGELLPVDFCKNAKICELTDISDDWSPYLKLLPIMSGEESSLVKLRSGVDANKTMEGVPDGFVQLLDQKAQHESCRFFLAFAFLTGTSSVNIYCAGKTIMELGLIPDYLQRLPGISKIIETPDTIESNFDGIKLSQNKTKIKVQVLDQRLWNCMETEETPSPSVFFMRTFIRIGWFWDDSVSKKTSARCFSHYILVPADDKTARALFVEKACLELEHVYLDLNSRKDVENWLEDYYSKNSCGAKNCPPLDVILERLAKSQNSEVRDFALTIKAPKNDTKPGRETFMSKAFLGSGEPEWDHYILDWIRSAKKHIQIISPAITSDSVFQEFKAAGDRGVHLQIITSLLDNNGRIKDSGDKQFSSVTVTRKQIAALGVSIRATRFIPHIKLIIIDQSIVLFTSANLYDNSLGLGERNALETCVLLQEASIVKQSVDLFNALWKCAPYVQASGKSNYFIAQDPGADLSSIPASFQGKEETLVFSCPQSLALEKMIASMLKKAKKEVVLMAMSFYDLSKVPELFDAIMTLLKKDIPVIAIVRPGKEQNFSKDEWPDPSTKSLLKSGMRLKEVPHLHAKGVIVDGKTVLAMSANFNPYSLGNEVTSHLECGLLAGNNASWKNGFIAFVQGLL